MNYYLITGFGAAFLHYLIIHFQISGLETYFTSDQLYEIINSTPNTRFVLGEANMLKSLYYTPVVGASGAVFGLLLAYGMTYPNQIIYLNLLFPIKAKYFVIIYGLLEFFMGIQNSAGDNVAHFAHIEECYLASFNQVLEEKLYEFLLMLKELFLKYKVADPLFKLIYINLLVFILVQICNTSSSLFQSALFDLVFC